VALGLGLQVGVVNMQDLLLMYKALAKVLLGQQMVMMLLLHQSGFIDFSSAAVIQEKTAPCVKKTQVRLSSVRAYGKASGSCISRS
jgi:hypothetical protein